MSATARIARPRGESKQDYCTPRAFLDAVERRFGRIVWDLAATREQSVCGQHFFGPGSVYGSDAIQEPWVTLNNRIPSPCPSGLRWLNPPFAHIAPWAQRCALFSSADLDPVSRNLNQILFLVPASIGANWYWDHVAPHARTFSVGRMVFVTRHADGTEEPVRDSQGKAAPFPKDLMLCVFGLTPGLERWRWQDG